MAGKRCVRDILVAASILISISVPCIPVWAQEWSQEIEEIIVTTRHREENLQEIPIAVTAISADTIERMGITNMFQLGQGAKTRWD